jgi:hypothetical protein
MTIKGQQQAVMFISLLTMVFSIIVIVEINHIREDVSELKRK